MAKAVQKVVHRTPVEAPGEKPAAPAGKELRAETGGRRRKLVDAEIYSAATDLFARKGYANTSLQDIAQALGLSRPALYHYVNSKEEILANLTYEFTQSRASELTDVVRDRQVGPTDKLRTILTMTVRPIAQHPARFRLLDRSEADLPADILQEEKRSRRIVRDAFVAVLREGIGAGLFRPVDPGVTAFGLIGMCAWVAWWFKPAGPKDVDSVVDTIVDLALNSVLARGAPEDASSVGDSLHAIRKHVAAIEVFMAVREDTPTT